MCLLILTTKKILILICVSTNLEDELEYQFPMIVFLRKWLLYDMLAFNNEKWGEVVKFNPMEKEMYWPFIMTKEKGLLSLMLIF
jgi:hypothetical protein